MPITIEDQVLASKLALQSIRNQILIEIRMRGVPKQETVWKLQQAHIEHQTLEQQVKVIPRKHKST